MSNSEKIDFKELQKKWDKLRKQENEKQENKKTKDLRWC